MLTARAILYLLFSAEIHSPPPPDFKPPNDIQSINKGPIDPQTETQNLGQNDQIGVSNAAQYTITHLSSHQQHGSDTADQKPSEFRFVLRRINLQPEPEETESNIASGDLSGKTSEGTNENLPLGSNIKLEPEEIKQEMSSDLSEDDSDNESKQTILLGEVRPVQIKTEPEDVQDYSYDRQMDIPSSPSPIPQGDLVITDSNKINRDPIVRIERFIPINGQNTYKLIHKPGSQSSNMEYVVKPLTYDHSDESGENQSIAFTEQSQGGKYLDTNGNEETNIKSVPSVESSYETDTETEASSTTPRMSSWVNNRPTQQTDSDTSSQTSENDGIHITAPRSEKPPFTRDTASTSISTDTSVLEKLARNHAIKIAKQRIRRQKKKGVPIENEETPVIPANFIELYIKTIISKKRKIDPSFCVDENGRRLTDVEIARKINEKNLRRDLIYQNKKAQEAKKGPESLEEWHEKLRTMKRKNREKANAAEVIIEQNIRPAITASTQTMTDEGLTYSNDDTHAEVQTDVLTQAVKSKKARPMDDTSERLADDDVLYGLLNLPIHQTDSATSSQSNDDIDILPGTSSSTESRADTNIETIPSNLSALEKLALMNFKSSQTQMRCRQRKIEALKAKKEESSSRKSKKKKDSKKTEDNGDGHTSEVSCGQSIRSTTLDQTKESVLTAPMLKKYVDHYVKHVLPRYAKMSEFGFDEDGHQLSVDQIAEKVLAWKKERGKMHKRQQLEKILKNEDLHQQYLVQCRLEHKKRDQKKKAEKIKKIQKSISKSTASTQTATTAYLSLDADESTSEDQSNLNTLAAWQKKDLPIGEVQTMSSEFNIPTLDEPEQFADYHAMHNYNPEDTVEHLASDEEALSGDNKKEMLETLEEKQEILRSTEEMEKQ